MGQALSLLSRSKRSERSHVPKRGTGRAVAVLKRGTSQAIIPPRLAHLSTAHGEWKAEGVFFSHITLAVALRDRLAALLAGEHPCHLAPDAVHIRDRVV